MTIPFLGGPYDGLKLGVVEIERHLIVLSIPARNGPRRFIYLPRLDDWPEVLAGRMGASDSREFHYYELVKTPNGLEARADGDGRDFLLAISRPRGPMGSTPLDWRRRTAPDVN